ncbi:MAG TPA: Ig-like domain-containing protein [Acidimicrobiia bacterium]|nr:Ig-like domain-containing protein [Acidimicrobiia bacterium]
MERHRRDRTRSLRRGQQLIAVFALAFGAIVVAANPAAAAAPGAPATWAAIAGPGVGQMTVVWSPPMTDGGIAITGYEVLFRSDTDPQVFTATALGTQRSVVVACPAIQSPGHGCGFLLRATNGTYGPYTPQFNQTWSAPGVPTLGRTRGGPGDAQATLYWRAPRNTGGLTVSYAYSVNDGSGWTAPTAIDPLTVTVEHPAPHEIDSAPVPCAIWSTNTAATCSYQLFATNAVGSSAGSVVRAVTARKPTQALAVSATTNSVALWSGDATQAISWNAPATSGGVSITQTELFACATALGTTCRNASPDWVLAQTFAGNPASVATNYTCPANGRCGYEVQAFNAIGMSWKWFTSKPAPPTQLHAVPATSSAGKVALSWTASIDKGPSFGNYVLFTCSVATAACSSSGLFTSNPADAAPWTRVDLVGTATSTTYPCSTTVACRFRVGYVDGTGRITGVTNEQDAAGLDAPVLTATANAQPGRIDLSWTAPTPPLGLGIINYQIDRDTGSGFTTLATPAGTGTTFTDFACPPGASCGYKVRAFYTAGTSADSDPEYATAAGDTSLTITAPTNGSSTNDNTPTFSGSAGSVVGPPADSATVNVNIYAGTDLTGTLVQTLPATRSGAAWTIDAAALADGTYTAQASQSNFQSTLLTSSTVTFTVDTTAPAPTITAPVNNGFTNTTPTISGARGVATGDQPTVTLNIYAGATATGSPVQTQSDPGTGATWTVNATALAPGQYTAQATQSDAATNNGTSNAVTFTVDTTPPAVDITSPTDGGATSTTPIFTGDRGVAAGDLPTVTVTLYAGATATGTPLEVDTDPATGATWSVSPQPLLAGQYTIVASQADSAGNTTTTASVTFTAS